MEVLIMKYGMKYSTIKYWQNQAKTLSLYYGYVPQFPINMNRTAQQIARDAILYASLLTPEQFRKLHGA
jgi:hypothetical protein